MSEGLDGRHIVVTRPSAQSQALAKLIREQGGEPVLFPAIEIAPVTPSAEMLDCIERLESFDLALFISSNAVEHAMPLLERAGRKSWPAALPAAAVGAATAAKLAAAGAAHVLVPKYRFDSEGLLELAELTQVRGKRIVLFRGIGGRELLADTLTARGAALERVECYARRRPNADPAPLIALWRSRALDAVIFSSSEGVVNFHAMVGRAGQAALRTTPVFATHARIAAAARELGCERVNEVGASTLGDRMLIDTMAAFFRLK